MKFEREISSWKKIYECILSPLTNNWQQFINYNKSIKSSKEVEEMDRERIEKLINRVECNQKPKGFYSYDKIKELLFVTYMIKNCKKYKEKVF